MHGEWNSKDFFKNKVKVIDIGFNFFNFLPKKVILEVGFLT